MNNNTKAILAVVAVAVVAGLFLVMIDSDEVASPSETTTQASEAQQDTTSSDTETEDQQSTEADRVFDVSMQNFSFSEDELNVNAGDTVTVNLTNNGGTHDFVIDELDVRSEVIASGQTSVTFTVPEDASGQSYSFYCSVSNHRAQGMEGQLTIN